MRLAAVPLVGAGDAESILLQIHPRQVDDPLFVIDDKNAVAFAVAW